MKRLSWKSYLLFCLSIVLFSGSLQANKNKPSNSLKLSQNPGVQKLVGSMTGTGNHLGQRLQTTLERIQKQTQQKPVQQTLKSISKYQQSPRLAAQSTQISTTDLSIFEMFEAQIANLESEYQADYDRILQRLINAGLASQITAFEGRGQKISKRFKQIEKAINAIKKGDIGQQNQEINRLSRLLSSFKRTLPTDLPQNKTIPTLRNQPIHSLADQIVQENKLVPSDNIDNIPAYLSQWDKQTDTQLASLGEWLVTHIINDAQAAPQSLPTEANSCNYSASDLASDGVDIVLSQEIKNLAEQFNYSPAEIFRYVSQDIKFEPYYGALKGATGTLHSQAGSATDQSSLLIALLRASNIPARYVKGNIQYTDATPKGMDGRAPRWLSTKTYQAAGNRLSIGQNPAAGRMLNANNEAIGIGLTHIWVEACIPYANYRGIHASGHGYQWIPLDASIEDHQYQAGIDLNTAFDYDNYLSERTNELPQEYYQNQIKQLISNDQDLSDVPFQGRKTKISYDVLPTTLPYFVSSYLNWDNSGSSETAVLPDSHHYYLRISAKDANDVQLLPEHDLLLSSINLNRLTLSFKGATVSDQVALDNWRLDGDLDTTLPCSINVIANLKLEGIEQVAGTTATDVCSQSNQLLFKITLSDSASNTYNATYNPTPTEVINSVHYSNIQAADIQALQVYAYQVSDRLLTERSEQLLQTVQNTTEPNSDIDSTEGEYLHIVGLQYMRQVADANRTIGQLSNSTGDSGNHLGLTSSKMKVDYLFDLPFAVHRAGMLVDMPGMRSRTIGLSNGRSNWDEFLLSGYAGSAYESYIWQENAGLDAVSTVRGLQYAGEQGIEQLTLTSANWATESVKLTNNTNASLNYSAGQINNIKTNYIDKSYTLKIPRSQIQYENWIGAVFVAECNNCQGNNHLSAGYIISGGYAGGYTITPSYPPIIYSPTINPISGYVPISHTPTVVNTQVINTGTPINSTTASKGFNFNQVFGGDPVNLVTGNFYHAEQDLQIPGRGGLPFVFERTYNSQNPEDSPLGYGWTHSFNHFLKFYGVEDNRVKVSWIDGSGGEKFFSLPGSTVPNNSPDFENDTGIHVRLKRESNGQYSITQKNGMVYTFASNAGTTADQKAKLLSIKDKNNNQLTLNYNNSNQDKLLSISDDLNRSLTLAYANGGTSQYIESLTDFSGRQWHYDINAAGDLIEVKTPLAVSGEIAPLTYDYYTNADGQNKAHLLKRKQSAEGKGMAFEYYANGQVFRHTDDLGASMRFRYNNFRRETVVTDERGYAKQHFFDEYGNPVKIVDADGATESFEYDPAAPLNRIAHTNKTGLKTQYQYDSNGDGDLIKITQPSAATIQYSFYNSFHQARKVQDTRGNISLMQYDSQGNLTDSIKLKAGIDRDPETAGTPYTPVEADILSWTRFQYDSHGNRIQSQAIKSLTGSSGTGNGNGGTLPTGPQINTTYDSNGLYPIDIARCGAADLNEDSNTDNNECQTATVSYDTLGRQTQGIDASWYATQTHYDDNNRVEQSTDSQGQLHSYTYDQDNQLLQRQLLIGNALYDSEQHRYDPTGRLTKSIDAGGHASQYQYDATGNLIKIIDPDNYSLTLDYDQRGNWTSAEDKEQHQVTRKLDALGRIQRITDPNNNTQRYEYYGASDNGRLFRQYDALDRVSEYHYNNADQVTEYIDHEGHRTKSQYDAAGRATRIVQPGYLDNNLDSVTYNQTIYPVTLYSYNLLGQQTEIHAGYTIDPADSNQDQTSLQQQNNYDDFNRQTQTTDVLNRSQRYQYNQHNQLSQSTDGNNEITTYQWQQGNLLKEKSNSAGTNSYYYNKLGQISQEQNPNAINSYAYDASHRLKSSYDTRNSWTAPTGQPTAKALHYHYSPGGLLDRLTDNQGDETDYRYDPTGRLTTLWDGNWDSSQFQYDAGGRLTQQTNPNGISQTYGYRADDSLQSHQAKNTTTNTTLLDQQYQFDPLGRVKQLTETLNNSTETTDYLYDPLGRLTQADNQNVANLQKWHYDALGNRTRQVIGTGTEISIHDAANQLIEIRNASPTGTLTQAFIYDGNGNQIKHCQGASVTRDQNTNDCAGSIQTDLIYNADQELIEVSKTGIPTEHYKYDSQGRRVEKIIGANNASNTNRTRYHYNGDNIYAQYNSTDSENPHYRYVQLGLDQPLSRYNDNDPTTYYLQGAHNNILGTTDEQGSLTTSQQYDSWGNTKNQNGNTPQYGYQGREPDNTGLIYYRARYYQPTTGRFTQQDPKGFIDGINKYAYGINSPINFGDPYGTSVIGAASKTIATQVSSYYTATSNYLSGITTGGVVNGTASFILGADVTVRDRFDETPGGGSFQPIGLQSSASPIGLQSSASPIDFIGASVGLKVKQGLGAVTKRIKTPYGVANQGADTASLAARGQVSNGSTLYRIGTTGKSQTAEAQFWSLENPLSKGYAQRYGIPAKNIKNANFIETATVKPGGSFITRPAPGVGSNTGGGIEVVVPSSGVNMRAFNYGGL